MKKSKSDALRSPKKNLRKAARKELESGITLRFLEVVNNLGHDAERIAKDIKKMSKQLAEKLSEQLKRSKKEEEKKQSRLEKTAMSPKKTVARKSAEKSISRAEKVVAKVAGRKGKTPVADAIKPAAEKEPGKGTVSKRRAAPAQRSTAKAAAPRGRRKSSEIAATETGKAASAGASAASGTTTPEPKRRTRATSAQPRKTAVGRPRQKPLPTEEAGTPLAAEAPSVEPAAGSGSSDTE